LSAVSPVGLASYHTFRRPATPSGSGARLKFVPKENVAPQPKPGPMNTRFALSNKPFFPITTKNLRVNYKRTKKKVFGKGLFGRRGLFSRSKAGSFKKHASFEGGNDPLFTRHARWPYARMMRKRKKLDTLSLSKLRYFIEKGRLDTRFPITQRHLQDSGCVTKIKEGVFLFNYNDFPFPYKIDIEVAKADQSSIDMIKAVGGTVTVVYMERIALRAHIKPWKYEVLPKTARPILRMVHQLEKKKARGALVRYIKPLWLIEEERRLQSQLRELRGEGGAEKIKELTQQGTTA